MDESGDELAEETTSIMHSTTQNFELCNVLNVFHDEVFYWVKPRSTTWFSRFLMHEYDNKRWVTMFRMTKPAVFALAEVLRPHIQRKDIRYRFAIPVVMRVACILFKLVHGANFTICSEIFAIGKSTVSKVLREVVHSINGCLKGEISWPTGERFSETQRKFGNLCSLPAVIGAFDAFHVAISKPHHCPADYYYFKSGAYSINCQAVVDSDKRFLDLYVGMPGSTNDSRVLRRSSLFQLASHGNLMDTNMAVDGFTPYVFADSGYPLLLWIMVPHREASNLSMSEALLNRKLKKGHSVVENAFGILKQSFPELFGKSDLHITFLPDVIVCCALLHNLLLRQSHDDVEDLLNTLLEEGMDVQNCATVMRQAPRGHRPEHGVQNSVPTIKRREIGQYLVAARHAGGLS